MSINAESWNQPNVLPYNLINVSDAMKTVTSICKGASKISHYGYLQNPSNTTVTIIDNIFANVYLIEK